MSTLLRIWRGRTSPAKAVEYERLLRETHLPSIAARAIPGFQRIELHRRSLGDQVEFVTVMWFDSLDAVIAYAGPDYQRAAISERARALLDDPDEHVDHYEFCAAA
jgi:antibiotic biosynthesis monooxygenase (ABM) superfamily enzyme